MPHKHTHTLTIPSRRTAFKRSLIYFTSSSSRAVLEPKFSSAFVRLLSPRVECNTRSATQASRCHDYGEVASPSPQNVMPFSTHRQEIRCTVLRPAVAAQSMRRRGTCEEQRRRTESKTCSGLTGGKRHGTKHKMPHPQFKITTAKWQ